MSMILTGKLELSSTNPVETPGGNTSTFTWVDFPTPFPTGSDVIVHATTQTFNAPDTPGIRLHGVRETGFFIRFNELYGAGTESNGAHGVDTVGWTAYTV